VTLEGIRPRGAKTAQKIEQSLRKQCEQQDTTFITYDPSSGLWTFEVQHFSKYGYESDDSEDESEPDDFDQENVDIQQATSQYGDFQEEEEMFDDRDGYVPNDFQEQEEELSPSDEYEVRC
jgi:hypothetical protein